MAAAFDRVSQFLKAPIDVIVGAKATPRDKLLFTIGTTAILWYYLSIFCIAFGLVDRPSKAIARSPGQAAASTVGRADQQLPVDMHQFMAFSITTISGTLATYLGMVLGLGQKAGTAAGGHPISGLQKTAAWAYFLSLILALAIWGLYGPLTGLPGSPDGVIITLGQSILGLFGGVLAVILNLDGSSNS